MHNLLYKKYLQTPEWKTKRAKCVELADNQCSECSSVKNLIAHHLTYDRVGEEEQKDLQCLCEICHDKAHNKKPGFKMLGREVIDGIEMFLSFSPHEKFVMSIMTKAMDYRDNICEFSTGTLNATDKVKFSKGYTLLENKDVLIRIKKGLPSYYMINPDLLQPNKEYFSARTRWNRLKSKVKDDVRPIEKIKEISQIKTEKQIDNKGDWFE